MVGLLCPLLAPTPLRALDPERSAGQHALRQWRLEEGLPQNSVRAITQTPDNLLWVATHAGLHRFDGVAFDLVTGHDALKRFHVNALVVDEQGAVWIGTNGGGLLRFFRGRFQTFDPGSRAVTALAADGPRLWVGFEDAGVALVDGTGIRAWGPDEGVPNHAVHDLAVDRDGSCWAAVLGFGVRHIYPDGRVDALTAEDGLPSDMVRAVELDADGRLWVGTHDGLARVHPESGTVHDSDDGPKTRIGSLLSDRDGNLWVGSHLGLQRFDGKRFDSLPQTAGRRLDVVWDLFEDREGHLWMGSLGGGLAQLFDGRVLPVGELEGLAARQTTALIEGPEGDLWVAVRDAGIQRYREGRFLPPITTEDGLSHNGTWSLDFDHDDRLWSASFLPAVDRLGPDGVETFAAAEGLSPGRVLTVLADRRGDVWASTSSGLNRFHDGRILHYTQADGLAHDHVLALAEAPEGSEEQLWIGTNGGLSAWTENRGFLSYTAADGLSNPRVWAILPRGDTVWIGTFGGGLHRLRNGAIDLILNASHGLPGNDVTSLVDDELGHLWIAGTRGLGRLPWSLLDRPAAEISQQPLPFLVLDVRDGMRSAESYGGQPSGIRDRAGNLWFTTLDGLARIDPRALEVSEPPRLVIREVLLDGEPISSLDSVELSPDHGLLSVSYTATTLAAPTRIRFRRRLSGLDDGWQDLGTRRRVELSRLPAGDYLLELEASDVQGRFHDRPVGIPFRVLPRFTETPTFFGLSAFALVALGLGLQQWRVRRLRSREKQLRQMVDEAVAGIRTLRGMLPMCAGCKKIRDDKGYWQGGETYISDHSEAAFSHGLCPECGDEYSRELNSLQDLSETVEAEFEALSRR